jgi:hypothetical protein
LRQLIDGGFSFLAFLASFLDFSGLFVLVVILNHINFYLVQLVFFKL